MFVYTRKFYKGWNYYNKVKKRNFKLVSWTLEYIIKQLNPEYLEYFKLTSKKSEWKN